MTTEEFDAGRSAVEALPRTWREIVTDPEGFFARMPETGGLAVPATFLVATAAVNALGQLLVGRGIRGAVVLFVGQLAGSVLVAVAFVLIAQRLFDGRAGFEPTFRVVAYASAPLVVFWVPVLGVLAWLYSAYMTVRGLERVHALDATRAVLTLVLGFWAVWLLAAGRTGGPVWF